MTLPAKDDPAFTTYMRGSNRHQRTGTAASAEWDQACRQRWRALALLVKAKLEAVESGIVSFEEEFLAHVVLPDGSTVYQAAKGGIAIAYQTGIMQPLSEHPKLKERRAFCDLPYPQQCALKCNDAAFAEFMQSEPGEDCAGAVRYYCKVASRSEILPGTKSAELWIQLLREFEGIR